MYKRRLARAVRNKKFIRRVRGRMQRKRCQRKSIKRDQNISWYFNKNFLNRVLSTAQQRQLLRLRNSAEIWAIKSTHKRASTLLINKSSNCLLTGIFDLRSTTQAKLDARLQFFRAMQEASISELTLFA